MNTGGTPRSRNAPAWLVWWALPLVWLSVPASAAEVSKKNPHLPVALRLYKELEYEEAQRVLDEAERWPTNTREEQVSIALLEGVLAFETHQPGRGTREFKRALALDPKAKLTIPVSPKVAAALEEARAELTAPPSVKTELPPPPEPPRGPGLKLPVAIGGGVVAVGGLLLWTRANALATQVRNADPSITTVAQLDDTVRQGHAFEAAGWILMGVGAATTVGSLLLLDRPTSKPVVSLTPLPKGAHLSVFWRLP